MSTRVAAAPAAGAPKRGNFAPFLIVLAFGAAIFILEASGKSSVNILFIDPLINALILLNIFVFGQFGLAIILFTLILRFVTLPFSVSQYRSMKEMQAAQPLLQEIQKKYKDPKRRQEETLKIYREHHINPLGCLMPTLIQFAVFFALYRALVEAVGGSPESLIGLSQRLYSFPFLSESIPLNQHFLWLDLGAKDSLLILPALVGLSTYIQQKMSVTPNANPQQQQQQQMMAWMLPMMLIFITLNLPSGVGVYWVVTNVFSLFVSYYVYGRAFDWRQILSFSPAPAPASAAATKRERASSRRQIPAQNETTDSEEPAPAAPAPKERPANGKRRGKRKNRR
jgi:YidC/Oxa1 family membrane protein insertase